MLVGELRKHLDGIPDDVEVVVGEHLELPDGERDAYAFHPVTDAHRHWDRTDNQAENPLVLESPSNVQS